jgi:serine/threonine-protein phosphatase 2A regulatory subunit B'
MLKTMKQRFSGQSKKEEKKEDSKSSSSGASSSKASGTAGGKQAGPSSSSTRPASAIREKPPIPAINEQTFAQYYSEPLPSFRDVSPAEKQYLFVQKLHMCSFTFDFTDPTRHVREKEMKRQTLLELVDYANSGGGKFTEAVSEDIVFTLSQNLFRTLPPARSHEVESFDAEEEEPSLDPAWPHLQVGQAVI